MKRLLKISLHPRVGAAIECTLGIIFLWWLKHLATPLFLAIWICLRFSVALLLVHIFVYYPPEMRRAQHAATLLIFYIGMLGFLMFLEWPPAWYIVGASFVLFPAASFWFIPSEPSKLSFVAKPFRRWGFLMTVISIAGFWSGLIALYNFQIISLHSWWLLAIGSAVITIISGWWWWVYELSFNRRWWLSLITLFIILSELAGSILLWPLGYLASGLLLTWWWYIVWLLLRFYNSTEGIFWKKQKVFLSVNAVLILIYTAFLVRWH